MKVIVYKQAKISMNLSRDVNDRLKRSKKPSFNCPSVFLDRFGPLQSVINMINVDRGSEILALFYDN